MKLFGKPKPPVSTQCTAITKTGAACRLPRMAGSDKCAVHQATS